MVDPVITNYLDDRKEKKLKEELDKALKGEGSNEDVEKIKEKNEEKYSLGIWLLEGAKRAGQRSLTTHPCTFSHPSSRSNHKDDSTSSIIAKTQYKQDGYVRSGNLNEVVYDSLGNAAAMDVESFLNLKLQDGKTVLEHIEIKTLEAKELLAYTGQQFEIIRDQFLAIKEQKKSQMVTSSKIKQVYFPVEDNYHLLSILTNIGLVVEIKNIINGMKFSDEVKELRTLKRENKYSDKGFCEIFNLTSMGYGGNKPQNISTLNSKEMGSFYLLPSIPPVLEQKYVRIPKKDFFNEIIWPHSYKQQFLHFHKLISLDYNNINIRRGIVFTVEEIIKQLSVKVWEIRLAMQERADNQILLKGYQKEWLKSMNFNDEEILNTICDDFTKWIIHGYEKVIQAKAKKLGKEEFDYIYVIVQDNMEAFR